jgi:dTDP-4-amino-4,6-dideoxygalactose transaminase
MEPYPPIRIPFNKPGVIGDERELVAQALSRGHISGDGHFTRLCHSLLEELLGTPRALLTTSCTHALEMAAILLDLKPGDEVIVPSFTFVSTANAFALHGAAIRFCDVTRDTLNMDPAHVERLISPRTRAIVPVHYAGVGCPMDQLSALARSHGIALIEDAAHALMGKYRGRFLGSFGSMAALSFHETKNFSCGEGGALLINDERFIQRAEIIREKGTNRANFFRGQVDKYTWVDVGSSYLPSDLLAALLYSQLTARAPIQAARRRLWEHYAVHLRAWADASGVRLPVIPAGCEQPFHLFFLLMPSLEARRGLIAHLRRRGILSVFHYVPLHLSPMGKSLGGRPGDCPVSEEASDRVIRLPLFKDMTRGEIEEVVDAVVMFAV